MCKNWTAPLRHVAGVIMGPGHGAMEPCLFPRKARISNQLTATYINLPFLFIYFHDFRMIPLLFSFFGGLISQTLERTFSEPIMMHSLFVEWIRRHPHNLGGWVAGAGWMFEKSVDAKRKGLTTKHALNGGFLKWGYPQSSSISRWDFPL